MRGARERLGVLRTRQGFFEFLELTLLGIHLIDALERKSRLLETRALRPSRRRDPVKLIFSRASALQRFAIPLKCCGHRSTRPSVNHLDMRRGIEQPLMLMLAAEVDRRADRLRKLAHASQMPIEAHPAPTVCANPARCANALNVMRIAKNPPLDDGALSTLAHERRIRALAHQKL